jgi:hypothetical protein
MRRRAWILRKISAHTHTISARSSFVELEKSTQKFSDFLENQNH